MRLKGASFTIQQGQVWLNLDKELYYNSDVLFPHFGTLFLSLFTTLFRKKLSNYAGCLQREVAETFSVQCPMFT